MLQKLIAKMIILFLIFSVIAGCNDDQEKKDQNQQGNMGGGMQTSDTGE
jgi:hypothetical protein